MGLSTWAKQLASAPAEGWEQSDSGTQIRPPHLLGNYSRGFSQSQRRGAMEPLYRDRNQRQRHSRTSEGWTPFLWPHPSVLKVKGLLHSLGRTQVWLYHSCSGESLAAPQPSARAPTP